MRDQPAAHPARPTKPPGRASGWWSRHPIGLLVAIALVSLTLASSWLVFPYLVRGQNLRLDVGTEVAAQARSFERDLWQHLVRNADGPGYAEVTGVFATPKYFESIGLPLGVSDLRPDLHLIFLVDEAVHTTELPEGLVTAYLLVDGVQYEPIDIEGLPEPDHHRATTLRFARYLPDGSPVLTPATARMELFVTHLWADYGFATQQRSLVWQLPVTYPDELLRAGTAVRTATPAVMFNFVAGLLPSILAPVLVQVQLVFLATMLALGAAGPGHTRPQTARSLMKSARVFSGVFVLGGGAVGALIGWWGNELLDPLIQNGRFFSVAAGLSVALLGFWAGIRADAPVLHAIRLPHAPGGSDTAGVLIAGLVAGVFWFGCVTSFSGALATVLVVHISAIGGAGIGALALIVVCAAVAAALLLAARVMSRALPVSERMPGLQRFIGSVGSLVMIGAGLLVAAGNLPGSVTLVYRWLNLW